MVGEVAAFTSAATATFTVGTAGTFSVTTTGSPAPSFGWNNVPPGMTFTDNRNGTATLAGTPTTGGTYAMALTAVNPFGTATQTLTVTVQQAPAITSAASATFTVGTAGTFSVTTTGSPAATLTETGALPSGVTFTSNGNGTATLAGTPAAGTDKALPDHDHRGQRGRHQRDPELHADRERGPDGPGHHQRRLHYVHRGDRGDVLGDDHRQPGGDAHRDRGAAVRRHLH